MQRRRTTETESIPELIERWLPTGLIAHVQVNDPNRRGPGQGDMKFAPMLAALKRHGYAGTIAVEPFDYLPDGPGSRRFPPDICAGCLKVWPDAALFGGTAARKPYPLLEGESRAVPDSVFKQPDNRHCEI